MKKILFTFFAAHLMSNALQSAAIGNTQMHRQTSKLKSYITYVLPYAPSGAALTLISSNYIPFKTQFRLSTEAQQRMLWGCFGASMIVIAIYFAYLNKKINQTGQRLSLEQDASISKDQEISVEFAIVRANLDTLIGSFPPAQRDQTRDHFNKVLADRNSPLRLLVDAKNDIRHERDQVQR